MIRSTKTTEMFLIRHAEAQKNIEKRHGGGNQNLTETGVLQAKTIGQFLLNKYINDSVELHIVHQPEERCKNTAYIIGSIVKSKLIEEPDFRGIGLGKRAGLSEQELNEVNPELSKALEKWAAGGPFDIPSSKGGEPMEDFAERIYRGICNQINRLEPSDPIALIGTTSSLTMINHLLETDGEFNRNNYQLYKSQPGSVACWKLSSGMPTKLNNLSLDYQ